MDIKKWNGVPIFDADYNPVGKDHFLDPVVDGEKKGKGLVERDLKKFPIKDPVGTPPFEIKTIPRSQWSDIIKDKKKYKWNLSDIRNRGDRGKQISSLDQNGQGYCWAYSTGAAVTLCRAKSHEPYVRLSPHAVAWVIKNGRDEGGWGALSAEFIAEKGIPSINTWPEKSMNGRQYNVAATWEEAKLYKTTEDFVQRDARVYDRNLTFDQIATCLLTNNPVVCDFRWWGHSVCAMDLVEVEPGSFGLLIINSWSDRWGKDGTGVLRDEKAKPMGAVAVCYTVVA